MKIIATNKFYCKNEWFNGDAWQVIYKDSKGQLKDIFFDNKKEAEEWKKKNS